MGVLTRTVDPGEVALYAETCFSCVICAYYYQRLCGHQDKMPKLWQGEERARVRHKKHTTAVNGVSATLQNMVDWLEEENERLGTVPPPPGARAASAATESPVAASSRPPSFNCQERLQELEETVRTLQGQCADLQRQNDDLQRRMNEMTRPDEGSNYYAWSSW